MPVTAGWLCSSAVGRLGGVGIRGSEVFDGAISTGLGDSASEAVAASSSNASTSIAKIDGEAWTGSGAAGVRRGVKGSSFVMTSGSIKNGRRSFESVE